MRSTPPSLAEHGACPYLPGRSWRSLSMEVEALAPAELERLLELGLRRSGTSLYLPRCRGCRACQPLRVPVAAFGPSRTQRRVWRGNQGLAVAIGSPGWTEERHDLYGRYLQARFGRTEAPSRREFEAFLGPRFGFTLAFEYRLEGRLVGLGIVDATPRAASSVYFAYEPGLSGRRLGVFSALFEIDWCRRTGRDHLYLGFRVEGSPTMAYKADYRPHELLIGGGWVRPGPGGAPQDRPGQDPRANPGPPQ